MAGSMEWETPDELFERLDYEFCFDIDVCASAENHKGNICFNDIETNALVVPWAGVCWMNPPYSKLLIDKFVKKAYEESLRGAMVVCLLPVSTSTQWFHKYVLKAHEIRFIEGRVIFKGATGSPFFSSMIVVFKNSETTNTPIISTMKAKEKGVK